ncbi:penicillin-binding transpeptidase domain-containing protein, partial [Blautia schinkii]|nr:penicillin-binding transpeptidase domain-containing protein [Blautia schinkii]
QAVTAEDLQEHKGEGYRTNSVIGKTGLETLYEKELKGTDGCEICIVDANGNKKRVISYEPKKDGEDIHTTIDGDLQSTLYEQFKEDRGCSVALNPYTGEVLALVSTPSYDNND